MAKHPDLLLNNCQENHRLNFKTEINIKAMYYDNYNNYYNHYYTLIALHVYGGYVIA